MNCGHEAKGIYCPNCGQKHEDIDKPVKEFLSELVGMINFDASFFQTIGPFLFKPGFLSSEYLSGKRRKYLSPVRLYLFLSVIFFFVSRIYFDPDKSYPGLNYTIGSDSTETEILTDSAALAFLKNDSLFNAPEADSILLDSIDIERNRKLRESIIKAGENQSLLLSDMLNFSSYALFILMPVFALLLKLLYIRRKQRYIRHLIFSINMHSFGLLVMTLVFSLHILFKSLGTYPGILMLSIPIYFIAGMKRYYMQNYFKTIAKTLILALVYSILVIITLVAITILAFIRL